MEHNYGCGTLVDDCEVRELGGNGGAAGRLDRNFACGADSTPGKVATFGGGGIGIGPGGCDCNRRAASHPALTCASMVTISLTTPDIVGRPDGSWDQARWMRSLKGASTGVR